MLRNLFFTLVLVASGAFAQTPPTSPTGKSQEPEAYRPRIHFSPATGWMSDPNGMLYYDGEYHLCYQHLPPGGAEGPHWGHAVSRDLLHWEHLPIALYPDSLGYIFSGSGVVDHRNTSGLGTAEEPPLLALFTYHNEAAAKAKKVETQSQALAYSTDKGRTWTKYAGNPVISNPGGMGDFRDPKVLWDDQTQQWVMALAAGPVIRFYSSKNFIDWELLSEFGQGRGCHVGPWECPDFFPLKVKGTNETKWVLIVSVVNFTDTPDRLATSTQYFIGDFDGKTFTSDQQDTLWIDYGRDCYAGVTFDNEPHGRRVFVGWMHSHQYAWGAWQTHTKTWSGAATFPRELNVVRENDGYRLAIRPVEEISRLYGEKVSFAKTKIESTFALSDKLPFAKAPVEINLSFDAWKLPAHYGVLLKNNKGEYVRLGYDRDKQQFYVDRTQATGVVFSAPFASVQTAPFVSTGKTMEWRMLVDAASVELFADDNKIVFTDVFFPSEPFDQIEIFSDEGPVTLKKGSVTALSSILPILSAND